MSFEVKKDFELKKKITINGKPIANPEDLPPLLRAIVQGLAKLAENSASGDATALSDAASESRPGAIRPEPLVGMPALILLVGVAAFVLWLVRSAL